MGLCDVSALSVHTRSNLIPDNLNERWNCKAPLHFAIPPFVAAEGGICEGVKLPGSVFSMGKWQAVAANDLAVAEAFCDECFVAGQSQRRGVVTPTTDGRSQHCGRVAVAHVQGSPKGGGALARA